jgi:hypothetical protein
MLSDNKIKKLLIEVDEDIFFKFKSNVASNKKTIKEVLTDFIKQYGKSK